MQGKKLFFVVLTICINYFSVTSPEDTMKQCKALFLENWDLLQQYVFTGNHYWESIKYMVYTWSQVANMIAVCNFHSSYFGVESRFCNSISILHIGFNNKHIIQLNFISNQ